MVIHARLLKQGIEVEFADDARGVIPWEDLELSSRPVNIALPNPYTLLVALEDGKVEEIPWDYARHYADPTYRAREEQIAREGRRVLGERIKRLRVQAGLSQEQLAKRSGINRVTLARIELGEHSPRMDTLRAIARGLGCDVKELLLD
jgi:DNA-binding XRE family transcriptional regulator